MKLLARVRSLVSELKRRKVFRVVLGYSIVAWAIVQIAAVTFPVLQLPSWTVTFVLVAVLLGFPLAVVLSWAYDITPDRATGFAAAAGPSPAPRRAGSPRSRKNSASAFERVGPADAERVPSFPARTKAASPPLPRQSTPFVGRAAELQRLDRLLADESARLINVCGPAGVGKTRLVLEAAATRMSRLADGARFVPLRGSDSEEMLASTIREALGLQPGARERAKPQLLAFLREKQLLLVLDNLEQLSGCGVLLSEIVEQAPGVTILSTSMHRLELRGETVFSLQGMQLPTLDDAKHTLAADSVQLFLQSARRVDASFEPGADELRQVVRICELVEGIPLAIELAAVWVRTLSCAEVAREIERDHDFLASNLKDLPERHRSLRSAFEAAWRLLSDAERRALRRLTVFSGGFTRESAAEVAGATVPLLSALIDKSLVRRSASGRFEISEVLRQYGFDKLQEDPEEREHVGESHTRYFLSVPAAAAGPNRGDRRDPVARIAADADNIRAAWRNALERRSRGMIGPAIDGIFALHVARGWVQDGERLFAEAVEALGTDVAGDGEPEPGDSLAGRLLIRQGFFGFRLGQQERAQQLIERGMAVLGPENESERALALDTLGLIAYSRGDYYRARKLHGESIAIFRALGDQGRVGKALTHLGNTAYATGAYAEAKERYHESLSNLRESGELGDTWTPLGNLGVIAFHEEAAHEAERYFREALDVARELSNSRGVANSLQNLGYACYMTERYAEAEPYLTEAVAISREMGYTALLGFCLNSLANVAVAQQDPERAGDLYRQALSTAVRINEPPLMLEVLIGLARLLNRRDGQAERAAELVALVLQHPASDQATRDSASKLLDELRASSAHPLDGALERGRALDLQTTVADLLALHSPAAIR